MFPSLLIPSLTEKPINLNVPLSSSLRNFVFAGDWGTAKRVRINPSSKPHTDSSVPSGNNPRYSSLPLSQTIHHIPQNQTFLQRSRHPPADYLKALSVAQIMWRRMAGQWIMNGKGLGRERLWRNQVPILYLAGGMEGNLFWETIGRSVLQHFQFLRRVHKSSIMVALIQSILLRPISLRRSLHNITYVRAILMLSFLLTFQPNSSLPLALRHENVWESSCINPRFLHLGTNWS